MRKMITLPDPISKKVGSINLFRMFLYERSENLMKSFDRFYLKYKTLDLRCDSKRFQHAYSLEDVRCGKCNVPSLSIAYEPKLEEDIVIGMGAPRIVCSVCDEKFKDPQDLEVICTKHKDPTGTKKYTKFFLIGNNNTELELMLTLMAADIDSDSWFTTQYFQAFNSEDTTAASVLNFLTGNRKLRRPKKFEEKTLDISPFNRKNNLFQITDIGRSYYQKWLENSGFQEHLPKFVKHRDAEIFELVELITAKKEYKVRASKFKRPFEEQQLQVIAKHVPGNLVAEIWESDYEKFWAWQNSLKQ